MANLLSSGVIAVNNVPEKYIIPPSKRPVSSGKINPPKIDLLDEENSVNNIMKAAREFGLFEVTNHGIPKDLLDETMKTFQEVFKLTPEEKSEINRKDDLDQVCKMYQSTLNFECEKFHCWRDILSHICTPLDETIKYWPEKPQKYRELVAPYVLALKDLSSTILDYLSQGLGLEQGYLTASDLSKADILTINHYPPCPDPSLTMGLPTHVDATLINVLQVAPLDVPGLQVFQDGQWFDLEVSPDAFLVFIGNQLEVISNGQLKASVHRAVTNAEKARTTAGYFTNPSMECVVEPAKVIVEAQNHRALYKSFKYKDYFIVHTRSDGDRDNLLEECGFKIK